MNKEEKLYQINFAKLSTDSLLALWLTDQPILGEGDMSIIGNILKEKGVIKEFKPKPPENKLAR